MARTSRRTAAQRVAAKQDRARRDLTARARRGIDRVKALAELEDLRDRTSYTGTAIPGPLRVGYTAIVICIPPAESELIQPGVDRISWHPTYRAAWLAATAAADAAGGDHRKRVDQLEQLIKETP